MGPHYLDFLFSPKSIAVFGASENVDSVGATVFLNLIQSGFPGQIYAINPKHSQIHNQPCYADLNKVSHEIDLAVIATPAQTVPQIIHDCGEHSIRAVIIISAGFNPTQENNLTLLNAVLEETHRYGIRILGPNCLGLIRPAQNINATFSKNVALPGSLALVSQSGALCTAILDWAASLQIGFSAVVSLGDAVDIDFGDILDYLALDPETKSILLYIEGIRLVRRFMSSLRSAARMKPVVIIKVGRHQESATALLSHTGSMVGSDDVFDAAIRRAGGVRVHTVEQLFAAAQLLADSKRIKGNRLAIITNGGGPAIMATDRAFDYNIVLSELDTVTVRHLKNILPSHWLCGNPIDILGDATPQRYKETVAICLEDSNVDGVLVILTPQAMTQPEKAAQAVIDASKNSLKPVLTCWMGNLQVSTAQALFANHKIPSFPTPETAIEAFAYLIEHYHNQQLLLQVPGPLAKSSNSDISGARMIIDGVISEKRNQLNSAECRALLSAFSIAVIPMIEAQSANEVLVAAETLGFPVVLKINSPAVIHKSDVNGVRLNISNAQSVRSVYHELIETVHKLKPETDIKTVLVEPMHYRPFGRELNIGVIRDPVFGPVISFGAGGYFVELLRDHAVALPPLNSFIIDNLINRTRVAKLLGPFRNLAPIDFGALKQLLRSLSELVCEIPAIRELELNPVVASDEGITVLDVRVIVDKQFAALEPYAHMAIHPYPTNCISHWQSADGNDVVIRPIRPEDAEIERTFVRKLSPQSKYFRFMQALIELTPQMLVRFTQIDYDREMALIAVLEKDDNEEEIAVARYVANPDGESCEFAIVVADEWHNKGLGSQLLKTLAHIAKLKGFRSIKGEVLASNRNMLELAKNYGFTVTRSKEDANIELINKKL